MSKGRGRVYTESLPSSAPFLREQRAATLYTRRWHLVNDWAEDTLSLMDNVPVKPLDNNRVTLKRSAMVYDITDDEEAYARGLPLEHVDVPSGPVQDVGGRRRVVIRWLTWIPDHKNSIAYDPQWVVTGHGLTAHSASSKHDRYVRDYSRAVARGVESRRLLVTACEILFWTASVHADYI